MILLLLVFGWFCRQQLNIAMKYLIEITKADDKDLFSICMDFWHEFTKYIYGKVKAATTATGHAVRASYQLAQFACSLQTPCFCC